jgi:hypothetical protein
MNATDHTVILTIVYDLSQDPGAWDEACRHARLWGRLYTDGFYLDPDHIVLVFRPAPDERWRDWEKVRRTWIMEELAA